MYLGLSMKITIAAVAAVVLGLLVISLVISVYGAVQIADATEGSPYRRECLRQNLGPREFMYQYWIWLIIPILVSLAVGIARGFRAHDSGESQQVQIRRAMLATGSLAIISFIACAIPYLFTVGLVCLI